VRRKITTALSDNVQLKGHWARNVPDNSGYDLHAAKIGDVEKNPWGGQ